MLYLSPHPFLTNGSNPTKHRPRPAIQSNGSNARLIVKSNTLFAHQKAHSTFPNGEKSFFADRGFIFVFVLPVFNGAFSFQITSKTVRVHISNRCSWAVNFYWHIFLVAVLFLLPSSIDFVSKAAFVRSFSTRSFF